MRTGDTKGGGRMRRVLWALSLVAAVGLVGAFAAVAATGLSPQPRTSFDFLHVQGNCGEQEHANDAACAGMQREDTPSADARSSIGDDVHGPCDEAEHAGDPRCTGVQQPEVAPPVMPFPEFIFRGWRDGDGGWADHGAGSQGPGHGRDDRSGDDRRGRGEAPGHASSGSGRSGDSKDSTGLEGSGRSGVSKGSRGSGGGGRHGGDD